MPCYGPGVGEPHALTRAQRCFAVSREMERSIACATERAAVRTAEKPIVDKRVEDRRARRRVKVPETSGLMQGDTQARHFEKLGANLPVDVLVCAHPLCLAALMKRERRRVARPRAVTRPNGIQCARRIWFDSVRSHCLRCSRSRLRLLCDVAPQVPRRSTRHGLHVRPARAHRRSLASVRDPGPAEFRYRKFERIGSHSPVPIAAVGETLDFHEAIGPSRKEARLRYLSRLWTDRLAGVPGIRFLTSLTPAHCCAIVHVMVAGVDAGHLATYLQDRHELWVYGALRDRPELQGLWVAPNVFTRPADLIRLADELKRVAQNGLPT
jgi:hypothetical protein